MNEWLSIELPAWFASYLLHSTVLLAIAWLLDACGVMQRTGSRELLWRVALFGAVFTASMHVWLPQVSFMGSTGTKVSASSFVSEEIPPAAPFANMIADVPADAADGFKDHGARTGPTFADKPSEPGFSQPNVSVLQLLLTGWLLVASTLLLRLAVTGVRAARELSNRTITSTGDVHARLVHVCKRSGSKVPVLSMVDDLPGPISLPNGEICLPRWAGESLTRKQLDAMLAHELAHVRRYDALILILATIVCALFFFQPLNRVAHRRLGMFAELNADAFATTVTRDPRSLAETLAECARKIHAMSATPHSLRIGVAMASRNSSLVSRVERLLGDIPMKDSISSHPARIAASAVLLGALLMLPAFAPAPVQAGPDPSVRSDVKVQQEVRADSLRIVRDDTGDKLEFELGRPGYFLVVEAEGKVSFTEDEKDVVSVEDGKELLIREKRDGVVHELRVRNEDGELRRRYSRDRREAAFDAAAREWLAKVIPKVLRNTALDAEQRIPRLLDKGGMPAVLEEMEKMESAFALSRYVDILLRNEQLDDADLARLLDIVKDINSDFEMRNALSRVIENQQPSPKNQVKLLRVAAAIGSDFELAELIRLVTPRLELNDAALDAWRELVAGIGSDFELRRALTPVFKHSQLPKAWKIAALDAAQEGIGSDFELRSLLEQAARHIGDDAELLEKYMRALDGIGSDFEARVAVIALIDHATLDTTAYILLLDAIKNIGSDFETLQVLMAIAQDMPRDAKVVEKYREIARGLSGHERDQAESALD